VKAYQKRIAKDPKLVAQYEARVTLFVEGVRGASLNDHALTGNKHGERAFSVNADIRVVYIKTDEAFVFVDVGTHNQVY
jgi:addiction module RelE/StbE family toxin